MSESNPLETNEISSKKSSALGLTRRTVVATAAWSVPAIMVAQSAYAAQVSCFPVGSLFTAQARGILLSGFLGGVNLDNVVELQGQRAIAPTQGTPIDLRTGATDVSVLGTLNANVGGLTDALSTLLSIVAPADAGVLNQFARANINGEVRGASGAVTDSGSLQFETPGAATFPDFATIDLRTILNAIGGPIASGLVGQVTDLRLRIGAVTGRAALQSACIPGADNLQRDYQIGRLDVTAVSPLIAAIVTAVTTTLNAVTALSGFGSVLTVDSAAIFAGNLPGAGQPIQLQLGATPATITIDLAALLGPAPGQPGNTPFGTYSTYLNTLPPNSTLFVDNNVQVPGAAVANFIAAVISELSTRLRNNIFLNGTPIANVAPVLVLAVTALLDTLLTVTLVSLLGFVQTLLLTPLFSALSTLINIDVNAQNRSTNPPGPTPWNSLPVGRYDVAALYIRTLTVVNLLDLFIARGSVGENIRTGQLP